MTNETKPSYKAITKEQIEGLEKHLLPIVTTTGNSLFIALDDLREIFDNAPSVGEPVAWCIDDGFAKKFWTVKPSEDDYLAAKRFNWLVYPLYTTPQLAPSVGNSEPVGEIKITWYNDTGFEYGIKLYGLELRTQKEYEQWIKTTFKGEGVFKLYKEPQPDRVAELEEKLKEYEADAKRYQWLKSSKKDHELTVCWWDKNGAVELLPERIDPAIDQAMKGGE